MCERAEVALIRPGREEFMSRIGQSIEEAALCVVDEDQGGIRLICSFLHFRLF